MTEKLQEFIWVPLSELADLKILPAQLSPLIADHLSDRVSAKSCFYSEMLRCLGSEEGAAPEARVKAQSGPFPSNAHHTPRADFRHEALPENFAIKVYVAAARELSCLGLTR